MNKQPEKFFRFSLLRRIEHWVMFISFTLLALTGLPQKYPAAAASLFLLKLFGGLETARIIHRVAAVALMIDSMVHIGSLAYDYYVKRAPGLILPNKQDLVNAIESLKYNLGFRKEPPKQGWFTFEEKVEYWALMWGTFIMVLTGFFLWNPITAARFFPAEWIPAAKAAHGSEALLAVLAVIIWHMYHVHIRHFNKSMFTGYLTREEVEHEHAAVLDEGLPQPPELPTPQRLKRRRNFVIVYGLMCVAWLAGVYWFVTTEQTAVAAPEPIADLAEVNVYAPLPPTPIALPAAADLEAVAARYGTTWESGISRVLKPCAECHNPGLLRGGLDLTSYQTALQGGRSGPGIVPGSPGQSLVYIWSGRPDHPIALNETTRLALWNWIMLGAPEK